MKRRDFITLLPQSQLVSSQSADRAGTSLRPLARHLAPVVEASTSVADSVPYHYYLLLYRACRDAVACALLEPHIAVDEISDGTRRASACASECDGCGAGNVDHEIVRWRGHEWLAWGRRLENRRSF